MLARSFLLSRVSERSFLKVGTNSPKFPLKLDSSFPLGTSFCVLELVEGSWVVSVNIKDIIIRIPSSRTPNSAEFTACLVDQRFSRVREPRYLGLQIDDQITWLAALGKWWHLDVACSQHSGDWTFYCGKACSGPKSNSIAV